MLNLSFVGLNRLNPQVAPIRFLPSSHIKNGRRTSPWFPVILRSIHVLESRNEKTVATRNGNLGTEEFDMGIRLSHMGGFHKLGVPQKCWIMENPTKIDDLEVPLI